MPDGVISQKLMEKILYDSYLGEGISDTELAPIYEGNSRDIYLKSILKKYNVSKQQYDVSLNWYLANLDIYTKIYDRVLIRLKKEESKILIESGEINENNLVAAGDTVDLWSKSKIINYTGIPVIGNLFTEVKNNETFVLGDSIHLKADILLYNISLRQHPRMVLTVGYIDETTQTITKNVANSDVYNIDLQLDTTKKLNYVVAGFYQNEPSTLTIQNISLMRIHIKKSKK
ncbi:MAG: DUF4296 domain-containing protein [Bacteroidales bacterium]|nr:DUF4296 domain-containing protein [Bacteroidales bacterium]